MLVDIWNKLKAWTDFPKILALLIFTVFVIISLKDIHTRDPFKGEIVFKTDHLAIALTMYHLNEYDLSGRREIYDILTKTAERKHTFTDHSLLKVKFSVHSFDDNKERPVIKPIGLGAAFFSYLSFVLFGYSVKSIKVFSLAILLVSGVLFCVSHWKRNDAIFIFILSVVALIIFERYESVHLFGYYYSRAVPIIGIIAFLHLYYTLKYNDKISTYSVISITMQSLILALLIEYRNNGIFYLVVIGMYSAGLVSYDIFKNKTLRLRGATGYLVHGFLPILILSTVHFIVIPTMKHPAYEGKLPIKPFWQKVYLGIGSEKDDNLFNIGAGDSHANKIAMSSKYNEYGKDLVIYSGESERIMRLEVFDLYKKAPLYFVKFYSKKLYKTFVFMMKETMALFFASTFMFVSLVIFMLMGTFAINKIDVWLVLSLLLSLGAACISSVVYYLHHPYLVIQTFFFLFLLIVFMQYSFCYLARMKIISSLIRYKQAL